METKGFEEHIINRVLEVERKLAEEALKVVLNFIKEKGVAHHGGVICPEMIMAEEKRPLIRRMIPVVLTAMCREGLLKLNPELTLECGGIIHYEVLLDTT